MHHSVVLFDDACLLCNRTVRFIIANDPRALYRFAALGSKIAAELLGASRDDVLETIVLLENETVFTRGDAVLRVLRHLRAPWPFFAAAALLVPRWIRDGTYRFIARNRYRLFGRNDQCPLLSREQRARFL